MRRDDAAPRGGAVSALGQRLLDALALALDGARPADLVLRDFFRSQPSLGRRDRGVIAETVFDVLRHRRLYANWAQSGIGPMPRRLALIAQRRLAGAGIAAGGRPALAVEPAEQPWLDRVCALDPASVAPPIRFSLPDWLWEALRATHGDEAAASIAQALLRPAPLDLRVNTLKTTVDDAVRALAADRIVAQPWPGVQCALRVEGKPALERSRLFESGGVEVQDAGSQLLALLAAPRRGRTVVDFCAGAGGKTLALAALLKNTGQVYACDVSAARLAKLRPRLARAGATNVQPMAIDSENDPKLVRLAGRADVVLVDAPCSGSGTLRRNPDLKWRIDEAEIGRLCRTQASILAAAARLVKPGGTLVYATCSLLAAENQRIAEGFDAGHPGWRPEPVGPLLERLAIGIGRDPADPDARFLQLRPDRDDCDGFFAACWTRAGSPA
ncbi:MAG: RsmB/NOP family class I SAM-dependent RNA methyltransferase [Burkholderiaceae bacterium]